MQSSLSIVAVGVVMRIEKLLIQTLLGAQLGLGTQPCYEALGNLVEIGKNVVITSG